MINGQNDDTTTADALFALSSVSFSMGPNPRALVGHVRTQAGSRPFITLATQKSHFRILAPSGNCGAPKGHTVAQAWHPMQKFPLTTTTPLSGLLTSARVGQTVIHGASPQCMQARETYRMFTEGYAPVSILLTCLNLDPFPGKSFWSRQATIHAMQPLQRDTSKENPSCVVVMIFPPHQKLFLPRTGAT